MTTCQVNLHNKRVFGYRLIASHSLFLLMNKQSWQMCSLKTFDMNWSKTPQFSMTIISCFSFRFVIKLLYMLHCILYLSFTRIHKHTTHIRSHSLTHTHARAYSVRIKLALSPCQNQADNKLHDHSHILKCRIENYEIFEHVCCRLCCAGLLLCWCNASFKSASVIYSQTCDV